MNRKSFSDYGESSPSPPFLTGAIPLYWGCEEVKSDFNPNAFLPRGDYASNEEFVDHIRLINEDSQRAEAILNEPVFSDNKKPDFFHLEWLLSCFENIL